MIYRQAVRDEIWSRGMAREARLTTGESTFDGRELVAIDRLSDRELLQACDDEAARVRELIRDIDAEEIRFVVRATSDEGVKATIRIRSNGVSIVTTPEFVRADAEGAGRERAAQVWTWPRPLVWRNGSAAVLLHEAIGHPREHDIADVAWPPWLDVNIGFGTRRASFTDVPLRRMTHVSIRQNGAPFALPEDRIEIEYVAGGSYDPLTDLVSIQVEAPRLTISRTRSAIASAMLGATGDPIRYPGVVCSREGQSLYVPSEAPVLVTDWLS